jgi:hypothetical protein
MSTPRDRYMLYARAFPGWERLRAEVASALGLPADEVRGLSDEVDPTVRLEAHLSVMGFQLRIDLWVDPKRGGKLSLPELAAKLARQLDVDFAYHDGSAIPVAYVVVRPGGQRYAAVERDDDSDGLSLDESAAHRPMPS